MADVKETLLTAEGLKKLEEELLEDYGNEIIYDELWDILSQDKNIEKLLERCYNLVCCIVDI